MLKMKVERVMLMISDKLSKNLKPNKKLLIKKPENLKDKRKLLKTCKRERLLKQRLLN